MGEKHKVEKGMQALRITVVGRVQGVCFRAYTLEEARSLGLTGWVRNLPDGSVEILVEGRTDDLSRLVKWCHQGPPMAVVRNCLVQETPFSGSHDSFCIRY